MSNAMGKDHDSAQMNDKGSNSIPTAEVTSSKDVEIDAGHVTLKRELGLPGGISFVLGTIVGRSRSKCSF